MTEYRADQSPRDAAMACLAECRDMLRKLSSHADAALNGLGREIAIEQQSDEQLLDEFWQASGFGWMDDVRPYRQVANLPVPRADLLRLIAMARASTKKEANHG